MEPEASIYLLSYHAAVGHGILSKYLPAFVPWWSGCMEPETDYYLLSYHATGNYGIFSKFLPAFVPRGGGSWYFLQVFTCFRTTRRGTMKW